MDKDKDKSLRSTRWCWTINNYDDSVIESLTSFAAECTYIVWGKEVGESGTPHLQGCHVGKQCRLSALKKILPTAHFEVMRGTVEQAAEYCKKDKQYTEHGKIPLAKGECEKQRWQSALVSAKAGKVDEIPPDIYIRNLTSIHKIVSQYQRIPPSIEVLDNWWYVGPTGTGKSLTARKENPDYYIKLNNKWWDGYYGQSCVIIEEWGPEHWMLAGFLKQWADHHPFSAEVKGGTTCIRPSKIIVTSNYTLEQCFGNDHSILDPLIRRFKVKHFGPPIPNWAMPVLK